MLRNMSSIYSYSKISLSTETVLAIIDIGIYHKQFLQFIFINLYFMLHRPTKFRLFKKMSHARDVLCVLLNCFTLLSVHPKRIRWMQFVLFFFQIFIQICHFTKKNQNCSFTCFFQRILQSVCSSSGSKLVRVFFLLIYCLQQNVIHKHVSALLFQILFSIAVLQEIRNIKKMCSMFY